MDLFDNLLMLSYLLLEELINANVYRLEKGSFYYDLKNSTST